MAKATGRRLNLSVKDNTGFFAIAIAGGCEGDFVGDGGVDGSDLARLVMNLGIIDLSLFAG